MNTPPPIVTDWGGGGGRMHFCKLQCAGAANQRRQFLHLACNRWGGGGGQTILQTRILNNVDKSCNSSLSNKYLSNLKYYRKSNCTPKSALKCIMQKLQMSGMHPSPPLSPELQNFAHVQWIHPKITGSRVVIPSWQ